MAKPPDSTKTTFPTKEEAQWLVDNISLLPGHDHSFAESLAKRWLKFGKLSTLQTQWFWTMYDRAVKAMASTMGPQANANSAAPLVEVGNFYGVIALFHAAKQHLKFPKINLMLPKFDPTNNTVVIGYSPLVLHLAGPKSKIPGVVMLTNGEKYEKPSYYKKSKYAYYGYVTPDGVWKPDLKTPLSVAAEVQKVISALAKDPVHVAAEHGKLTGKCCFCNKTLTDEKSTAAGYGPVCAKHFGLIEMYKSGKSFFESLNIDSKMMHDYIAKAEKEILEGDLSQGTEGGLLMPKHNGTFTVPEKKPLAQHTMYKPTPGKPIDGQMLDTHAEKTVVLGPPMAVPEKRKKDYLF